MADRRTLFRVHRFSGGTRAADWVERGDLTALVCSGHESLLSLLLRREMLDPDTRDEQGMALMHRAAENGRLESLRVLIDAGADVNCVHARQWMPIALAARSGHADCVRFLLNRGAYVVTNQRRGAPLLEAAMYGHLECVLALLDAGMDVNAANDFGRTPIAVASDAGHEQVVSVLLERGAAVPDWDDDV